MAEESYPKLISLAVHELRTPVGVVAGYLRMLGLDAATPLSERQRKMIDEANKSCARLTALLAELSDLSKLDDGIVKIARQPMDLFPLVVEAAALAHTVDDRGVRLEARGQADGATILGDRDRLRTTIDAIFGAILREKPGPCLVVADCRLVSSGSTRSAVVVVSDEGATDSCYEAPAVPFDEKRGGVGLSLPLARRVIEAHGGRLWSAGLDDGRMTSGTALISLPLEG